MPRGERRIIGLLRKHGMHLAQSLPDGGRNRQIVRNIVGTRLGPLRCEVIDRAVEPIQHPRPGIALVPHKALSDGQRIALALLVDVANFPKQRRSVDEAALGQVATHLRFGMLSGRDAAEDLQHHGIVHDQRAVGLLRRQPQHGSLGRAP